jgi:hypothetical protein
VVAKITSTLFQGHRFNNGEVSEVFQDFIRCIMMYQRYPESLERSQIFCDVVEVVVENYQNCFIIFLRINLGLGLYQKVLEGFHKVSGLP